jgi:hypothetical protein
MFLKHAVETTPLIEKTNCETKRDVVYAEQI